MLFSGNKKKGASRGVIMDSLHGAINVFGHEMSVIDHPLFQRLRYILQNDVLHLTFVGSTHTRFAHSIGTAHVADRIYNQLIKGWLFDWGQGGKKVTRAQEDALKTLGLSLRLALLLHDSGHGAFSHQVEKSERISKFMESPGIFDKLWSGVDVSSFYKEKPARLYHEHYSVRVAHKIMTDVGIEDYGINISDVLNIMESTDGEMSSFFIEASELVWPLFAGTKGEHPDCGKEKAAHIRHLLHCILSGEFDADKADYLLRDSMYTGANYGKFDLDTLINNLSVAWIPEHKWLGLTISSKAVGVLEDMVHCRFQMYMHVYNHKTTNGMELLLHLAINELMEDDGSRLDVEEFLIDIDAFAYFTDDFFWEKFRQKARKDKSSFAYAVVNRNKIKHLGTYSNLSADECESIALGLSARLKVDRGRVLMSSNKTRFSKVNTDFTDIRVLEKDPIDGSEIFKTISETSDFFTKFNDNTIIAFHLVW